MWSRLVRGGTLELCQADVAMDGTASCSATFDTEGTKNLTVRYRVEADNGVTSARIYVREQAATHLVEAAKSLTDFDDDGSPNAVEEQLGTDPLVPDTNGDGIPDGNQDTDGDGVTDVAEVIGGTDPHVPNGTFVPVYSRDSDRDGILDVIEESRGTNPNAAGSDGDGVPDPNEPAVYTDLDHDGLVDPETDSDGDGDGTPDRAVDANGQPVTDLIAYVTARYEAAAPPRGGSGGCRVDGRADAAGLGLLFGLALVLVTARSRRRAQSA